MNIKRFQLVARVLSWVLLLWWVSIVIKFMFLGITLFIIGLENFSFIYHPDIVFSIYSEGFDNGLNSTMASTLVIDGIGVIISNCAMGFSAFQGNKLFASLADGDSPFAYFFIQKLKWVSSALVLMGVYGGLIYPLLVKFISSPLSYEIIFGFNTSFLFGLFLYVIAGVINYGMDLQALANDVV